MGLEDTSKQGAPPATYNMVYLRLHHPHNFYFYTRQTSGYPTTRQSNLIRIRHPQEQLQIHVLRCRQDSRTRLLRAFPRVGNRVHPMTPEEGRHDSHELNLRKLVPRAVLRPV